MALLRDDEQAALADLLAWGTGLVLRYRELRESAVEPELARVLDQLVERRQPLLDELAACAVARGDLPNASDREANEVRAVLDRAVDYLAGVGAAVRRLVEGEKAWLRRLREDEGLRWQPRERDLLARLEDDAERAIDRLRELDG